MARIRKNTTDTQAIIKKWKVALYIRLSREDGNDESYSVKNQRERLTAYLENLMKKDEMELVGFYVDDGFTGTDSNRDDFQRMLADIEGGIVNCVVVKDLSRLSRNDWECKKYLQHLFVVKNVRFISLELPRLDSFTRPDEIYEMGVSIQSMYNENHCRETSIKVRGTFTMKRSRGEFIGAFTPYGYIKDPADKHRLIVDEQAAPIVVEIFHWFVRDGMSKNGIVKKLNGIGIPCPSAYKQQNGIKYHNPAISTSNPLWSSRSITSILTNQMYLGHMVQGRQKVKSYKVHTRINLPESEWVVVENTHTPIVEKEMFEKAQELMKRDTRISSKSGQLHPFSGFLRCADCGKAMGRRTMKDYVYYACKTHTTQGLCTRHSIRHEKLEAVVLCAIQQQIALIDNLEQLMDEIAKAPSNRGVSKQVNNSLKQRKQELEKLSAFKTGLYMDWKNGDISREEYQDMKKSFDEKERKLKQDIISLQEENQKAAAQVTPQNPYFDAFRKYGNITVIDRGIVTELINTIHIHEGGDITIDWNFSDQHKRILEQLECCGNDQSSARYH